MSEESKNELMQNKDTATFGAGCFWCVEAVFQKIKGVEKVTSGYSGGITQNPTYKEICTGNTGHAEVIQVIFDPNEIDYESLLEIFWATHDPTSLNRQGNDVGTQYRSVIFYHSDSQKNKAEKQKQLLNEKNVFGKLVITEITKATTFYPAEDYHQDYYNNNKDQPYCNYTIPPKLDKLKKYFPTKLK